MLHLHCGMLTNHSKSLSSLRIMTGFFIQYVPIVCFALAARRLAADPRPYTCRVCSIGSSIWLP